MNRVSVIDIRSARPTAQEGALFARYLDTAASGIFRALLGRRFEQIVAEAYLSEGHDLSYETAVFAHLDGAIVGMASSYTWEQHRRSSEEPLVSAAGLHVLRMSLVGVVGRRLFTFIDEVPPGDYYLQAVAVGEEHRGAGIGSALIDDAEQRAVAAGCQRLALDVGVDNDEARRLYERRGMAVAARSPSIPFAPSTAVYRMTKAL